MLDVCNTHEIEIGIKAYQPVILDLGSMRLISQYMKMILAMVKKK